MMKRPRPMSAAARRVAGRRADELTYSEWYALLGALRLPRRERVALARAARLTARAAGAHRGRRPCAARWGA